MASMTKFQNLSKQGAFGAQLYFEIRDQYRTFTDEVSKLDIGFRDTLLELEKVSFSRFCHTAELIADFKVRFW